MSTGSRGSGDAGRSSGPKEAIVYSVITRDAVVLVEIVPAPADIQHVATNLVDKVLTSCPTNDREIISYTKDARHNFHVLKENGIIFLACCTKQFPARICFSFLNEIQVRFMSAHGATCHSAKAFAFHKPFIKELSGQMGYFSFDPSADKLRKLGGEIQEAKEQIIENIGLALDNSEKLDELMFKADELRATSFKYHALGQDLHKKMWWQDKKWWVLAVILLLVCIAIVVIWPICGGVQFCNCGGTSPNCKATSNDSLEAPPPVRTMRFPH